MRRWFIQQELDLFRFRFNLERNKSSFESDAISEFLRANNLKFSSITQAELQSLQNELEAGTAVYGANAFYKVCLCPLVIFLLSGSLYRGSRPRATTHGLPQGWLRLRP